ncbi:HPP family protein [Photobacterium alginatilyticum]|uniref:HPP family protein n=1 Tax=Photobacterium alginatilyticum TaxID=1775171 RepID=UPI004068EACE
MNKVQFPIAAGIAATLAIGILSYLDCLTHTGLWLMAPFGATAVLVFGLPDSPLAKAKNVIAGHFLTALIGVFFVEFIGVYPWSLALATGLAITTMLLTKTTHPPAGANPMLIMLTGQSWPFLITPVLIGASSIVCLGVVLNKIRVLYIKTI